MTPNRSRGTRVLDPTFIPLLPPSHPAFCVVIKKKKEYQKQEGNKTETSTRRKESEVKGDFERIYVAAFSVLIVVLLLECRMYLF